MEDSFDWTIQKLELKRHCTDPLADQTINDIIQNHDLEKVHELFKHLVKNHEIPKDKMPPEVVYYLDQNSKFPEYTNWDLIHQGEIFFSIHGASISMMLLTKSLPASYACKKGAEVLYQTGRLAKDDNGKVTKFTRRLMETAQFVIDVMQPGGLEQGRGIRSAQKVRLMHAAIRHFLYQKNWDINLYDEPINQEDMAGTLMDFAVYPIEGLEKIGIKVSEQEKEAYFHVWRVIGHFLGVDADLIPENYHDGSKLGHMILNHQKGHSEAGVELTKACIQFLTDITPGTIFDFYPKVLVRYLIGDELADILEIKKEGSELGHLLNRVAFSVFDTWSEVEHHSEIIHRLAEKFNVVLLEGMINYFNHHKEIRFEIPPSLRQNWQEDYIKWKNIFTTPTAFGYRVAIQQQIDN